MMLIKRVEAMGGYARFYRLGGMGKDLFHCRSSSEEGGMGYSMDGFLAHGAPC